MSDFINEMLNPGNAALFDIQTHADGPAGRIPLTDEQLKNSPSGDIFAMSQNVSMGWLPANINRRQFLILSTLGGVREKDGRPVALGYHTGHWEIGLLVEAAAREFKKHEAIPFAGFCSDPCDGRIQGKSGMMDSLPYRNDAAIVLRRLVRCLPTRAGVMGVATCDKGVPAMMMALAAMHDLPGIMVLGGVTLPPTDGEDAGKIQSISARYAQGEVTLEYAQEMTCRTCATAGGGCQFLGTAATSQVVSEALGLSIVHSALAPSGQAIWLDSAERSARALLALKEQDLCMQDILTDAAVRNAMVVHAAFGGSTNLILHIPAIAHAAGLGRPTVRDWHDVNRQVPRLVDVLPNGPVGHPTVRVFLAGGVPEVMLRLRDLNMLDLDVNTASGVKLGDLLVQWQESERRAILREELHRKDNIDPDEVIMLPEKARERGLTSTVTFPVGNIAPEGSVIKSTAIDPGVVDDDGVYRLTGPAKVFIREHDAINAIKDGRIKKGDIMLLICAGPQGSGMEETYEVTSALKHLSWGKHVALITDARFSGVSTGACIGHVGPEALAGGPVGKLRDGDIISIVVDRSNLEGSIDLVGRSDDPAEALSRHRGDELLTERQSGAGLSAHPDLPEDTRLWAALQSVGGGTWGGCVYDVDEIVKVLEAGKAAMVANDK